MPASNWKDSVTQIPDQMVAPRGWVVRSPWARSLLTFLMVFGPRLIVMEADNDAGTVSTYVQAGAQYGTHLLRILILLLPMHISSKRWWSGLESRLVRVTRR